MSDHDYHHDPGDDNDMGEHDDEPTHYYAAEYRIALNGAIELFQCTEFESPDERAAVVKLRAACDHYLTATDNDDHDDRAAR